MVMVMERGRQRRRLTADVWRQIPVSLFSSMFDKTTRLPFPRQQPRRRRHHSIPPDNPDKSLSRYQKSLEKIPESLMKSVIDSYFPRTLVTPSPASINISLFFQLRLRATVPATIIPSRTLVMFWFCSSHLLQMVEVADISWLDLALMWTRHPRCAQLLEDRDIAVYWPLKFQWK